jgi:hypothetical protein
VSLIEFRHFIVSFKPLKFKIIIDTFGIFILIKNYMFRL